MIGAPVRVAVLRADAAAVISTAAACSSSSTPADQSSAVPSSASVAARAPPTGTSTATHDAFAQCLSDNGVPAPPGGGHAGGPPPNGTLPSGPPPSGPMSPPIDDANGTPPAPPGVDQAAWDKALQACSSLAPAPREKE